MGNEMTKYQAFRHEMDKSGMTAQLKAALPVHISVDKFKRVVMTAVNQNEEILTANQKSLFAACMHAAQDGLLPDGREAALVKFKNEVKYMPMVAGVLKKCRNSGQLKNINAEVVHENDEYDAWSDENGQHFKFRKATGERGAPKCTIAYANTTDGGFYFEEVSEEEMAAIESCARSKNVWQGPFRGQMKRKAALHRLSKRLPMSSDIEKVMERDEQFYDLESPDAHHDDAAIIEHHSEKLEEAMRSVEAEEVEPVREPGEDDLI